MTTDVALPSMLQRARAAFEGGDHAAGEALCQAILRRQRTYVAAILLRAEMALAREDLDAELAHVIEAVKLRPREAQLRDHLGKCYAFRGDYGKALVQFEKALKLDPAAPGPVTGKAHVFERQNKYDKARRLLEPVVRAGPPPPMVAVQYLRVLIHDGAYDDAIGLGRAVLEAGHEESFHLRSLAFQLARAYERSGDVDRAFATAVRANAMLAPTFDLPALERETDAVIDAFTRERLAALPRPQERSDLPVFIVGLPRSGSTLVERIIAAHPEADGAGEIRALFPIVRNLPTTIGSSLPYPLCVADLEPDDVDALAASYLDRLRKVAPRARRITDKYLGNHRQLGLIEVLFPAGRVIHCRRNLLDTCLSCYMEPFAPQLSPFTSDLRALGGYARDYRRLMRHWREVLDVPVLDVDYEALVDDQEGVSRAIIEFCGLPWNDACLRYHETRRQDRTLSFDQVRRPIYRSSVGRADRFGAHLDPLREALGDEQEREP